MSHHCRECIGSCELVGAAYQRGLKDALRIVRETDLSRVDKSNKQLIAENLELFISGKSVQLPVRGEEELGYPNFRDGEMPLG